jgi:large subunit ribosomal protein L9
MEVILLKHMENLGRRGEVVAVTAGYARNYLLPRRLAMRATAGAKRLVQQEARKFESLDLRVQSEAQEVVSRLQGLELSIAVKADDDDKLYGSVTVHDVHAALVAKGLELTRKQIVLEHPIKALGEYEVGVKLHLDVKGHVKVNVVREN